MGMHIIIVGNPIDGFNYIGPFKTRDHAIEWENELGVGADWWLAPLESADQWANKGHR